MWQVLYLKSGLFHRTPCARPLLFRYRLVFTVRMRRANLYASLLVQRYPVLLVQRSLGQVPTYAHRKKRKKTFLAAMELLRFMRPLFDQVGCKTLSLHLKGRTGTVSGIAKGLRLVQLPYTRLSEASPLAHNGTPGVGRRRL